MYEKRIVHQVGYLQELNRDARSTKQKMPCTISIPSGMRNSFHDIRA